jgi:hypothetical protein
MYKGEWFDDMAEGKGIYKYANGTIYDGSWVKNKQNGYGQE